MNRLVLVGNGFDLAHSLNTSYYHFISDYICNALNVFYEDNKYTDILLELKLKPQFTAHGNKLKFKNETALDKFNEIQQDIKEGVSNFLINIKSPFLFETIKKASQINWVDLENNYFDNLINCRSIATNNFNFDKVKKLNDEFDFIKTKLEEYLIRQKDNKIVFPSIYTELFCSLIQGGDVLSINTGLTYEPKNILILSFNYTKTLDQYQIDCNKKIPTQINYIHGKLESKTNHIIFGFGDEYDKNYIEFEDLKNNELLRHIKSFSYLQTSNYHDLIRFIQADSYQVYILGHSCGLSDRTMLKEIFENEKCKSIKIFYHDKGANQNDYTDKTYEISKHFSDKGIMRKKIVSFDKSSAMPQPIKM